MRGEKDVREGRTYCYMKCQGCGAKLHIDAHRCLECGANLIDKYFTGEWQQVFNSSHDPGDAIYSVPMNRVEKCMRCVIVTQRGIVCQPKYCFGTARGKCGYCRTFDSTIFCCCQEVQKAEEVASEGF